MELTEVLRLTRNFILENLSPEGGTLDVISASYDENDEVWDVEFDFVKTTTDNWVRVRFSVDDSRECVDSFEQLDSR